MPSLENRGNGSWRIIVSNGYNPDGSKRRLQRTVKVDPAKTVNAQRKEVEKLAAALETDYRRHLITDGKKITLAALVTSTAKIYLYLPVLMISGTVTGLVLGIAASLILERMGYLQRDVVSE